MNQLDKIFEDVKQWIWADSSETLPVLLNPLRMSIQMFIAIARDLGSGQLSLRAMSLVYTTGIAIVPFLALSFSVLKGFGLHQNLEPALLDAMVDIGDKRFDIVATIMGFINNVNVGVLGAAGFAILIYSVMSMMHKIEGAFNYTWRLSRSRQLAERIRDYLSVIFVAPLLIFLSAAVTTTINTNTAIDAISSLPLGVSLLTFLGRLLPYLLMSVGFAVIYMFLPNTRVKFQSALVGGLVTAVIWKTMGWGISLFVANSASNIAIYSAFASIIVLMVWMYVGWLVLLVGCSIAFYRQNPQHLRRDKASPLSSAYRQILAVDILCRMCDAYDRGGSARTIDELASDIGVDADVIESVLQILGDAKLVYCLSSEAGEYVPAKPSNKIVVEEVFRLINDFPCSDHQGLRFKQEVLDSYSRASEAVRNSIGEISIAQMLKQK